MSIVTIRMYNVGFGDCFRIDLPDPNADRPRTVVIDCGRHCGTMQDEPPFWDVVGQLVAELPVVDDHPHIDVLAITHRHRDHVHGFSRPDLWKEVTVGELWLPWTENANDPVALGLRSKQNESARRAFHALRAFGSRSAAHSLDIALNSITNERAVSTLAAFRCPTHYLPDALRPKATTFTGGNLGGATTVHVLGPSRDPSIIKVLDPPAGSAYLRLRPDDASPGLDDPEAGDPADVPALWDNAWTIDRATYQARIDTIAASRHRDSQRVDGDLLDDVERAASSDPAALAMALDKSINGTSLVLLFDVGGLLLLFPGDAQWGTWREILATEAWTKLLGERRVGFLKIGHHGSHNATPVEFVEGGFLKESTAMVSVSKTAYTSKGWKQIPKTELLDALVTDDRVRHLIRSDERPLTQSSALRSHPRNYWVETSIPIEQASP
jgi:hypothetical protein